MSAAQPGTVGKLVARSLERPATGVRLEREAKQSLRVGVVGYLRSGIPHRCFDPRGWRSVGQLGEVVNQRSGFVTVTAVGRRLSKVTHVPTTERDLVGRVRTIVDAAQLVVCLGVLAEGQGRQTACRLHRSDHETCANGDDSFFSLTCEGAGHLGFTAKSSQHGFHRLCACRPNSVANFRAESGCLVSSGYGYAPVGLADCGPGLDNEHPWERAESTLRAESGNGGAGEVLGQLKGANIGRRTALEASRFGSATHSLPAGESVNDKGGTLEG